MTTDEFVDVEYISARAAFEAARAIPPATSFDTWWAEYLRPKVWPVGYPTADELRADHVRRPGLNAKGVDFEKAALELAIQRRPKGWRAPIVLPPLWRMVDTDNVVDGDPTRMYQNDARSLRAILSCVYYQDGRAWLHLSLSHRERIPAWDEMGDAKRVLLGDREAYQVIPPKSRYVNINERVLHMFALLDPKATALPDFTRGTNSL